VTGALIAVVLIAIGLPVVAWWIGGQRFRGRLAGPAPTDLHGEMVRRHRLTAGEIAQVQQAMVRGRRLDDARLRAAVVDWARAARQQMDDARRRHPWRRRILVWSVGLAAGCCLVALVLAALSGEEDRWLLVVLGLNLINLAVRANTFLRTRGTLTRAIAANDGPPGEQAAGATPPSP
jgi:hypothetical protein